MSEICKWCGKQVASPEECRSVTDVDKHCWRNWNTWSECHQVEERIKQAASDQNAEMRRYLPILERAEADPEIWSRLTAGTGIATLNGYLAAIAKAERRDG